MSTNPAQVCSLPDAVSQQVLEVGRAPCATSAGALILCSPRNGGGTGRDPVGEDRAEGCRLCWVKASEDRVRLPGPGRTCTPGGRLTSSFLPPCLLSCLEFPAAERGGRIPGKLALGLMRCWLLMSQKDQPLDQTAIESRDTVLEEKPEWLFVCFFFSPKA